MNIEVKSYKRSFVGDKKIVLYGCNAAAKLALNVLKNWGGNALL